MECLWPLDIHPSRSTFEQVAEEILHADLHKISDKFCFMFEYGIHIFTPAVVWAWHLFQFFKFFSFFQIFSQSFLYNFDFHPSRKAFGGVVKVHATFHLQEGTMDFCGMFKYGMHIFMSEVLCMLDGNFSVSHCVFVFYL